MRAHELRELLGQRIDRVADHRHHRLDSRLRSAPPATRVADRPSPTTSHPSRATSRRVARRSTRRCVRPTRRARRARELGCRQRRDRFPRTFALRIEARLDAAHQRRGDLGEIVGVSPGEVSTGRSARPSAASTRRASASTRRPSVRVAPTRRCRTHAVPQTAMTREHSASARSCDEQTSRSSRRARERPRTARSRSRSTRRPRRRMCPSPPHSSPVQLTPERRMTSVQASSPAATDRADRWGEGAGWARRTPGSPRCARPA